jgi:hypothetical protein
MCTVSVPSPVLHTRSPVCRYQNRLQARILGRHSGVCIRRTTRGYERSDAAPELHWDAHARQDCNHGAQGQRTIVPACATHTMRQHVLPWFAQSALHSIRCPQPSQRVRDAGGSTNSPSPLRRLLKSYSEWCEAAEMRWWCGRSGSRVAHTSGSNYIFDLASALSAPTIKRAESP